MEFMNSTRSWALFLTWSDEMGILRGLVFLEGVTCFSKSSSFISWIREEKLHYCHDWPDPCMNLSVFYVSASFVPKEFNITQLSKYFTLYIIWINAYIWSTFWIKNHHQTFSPFASTFLLSSPVSLYFWVISALPSKIYLETHDHDMSWSHKLHHIP